MRFEHGSAAAATTNTTDSAAANLQSCMLASFIHHSAHYLSLQPIDIAGLLSLSIGVNLERP